MPIIISNLCKSKNMSNGRVIMLKNLAKSHGISKRFFSMTNLCFDECLKIERKLLKLPSLNIHESWQKSNCVSVHWNCHSPNYCKFLNKEHRNNTIASETSLYIQVNVLTLLFIFTTDEYLKVAPYRPFLFFFHANFRVL